jgi:hypothetical protein
MAELVRICFIGVGATLIMDLWSFILRRFGVASLDYALVGRWIGHFARGRFVHDAIAQSQPLKGEEWLGWAAHYAIGVAFAATFAMLIDGDWFSNPRPEVAILFGLVTVLLPFFVMQPALGFGVAASRTPDPLVARVKSLMTHAVFGFGLYLSASVLVLFDR